jgi:hypothetical protein
MSIDDQFSDAAEKNFIARDAVKQFEEIASRDIKEWKEFSNLTIENCKKLTVTTTIKDRLEFFKNTLPNWLKFPFKKIIIVDWNSTEDIKSFVQSFKDERIVFARVENEPEYRHSAARNFKMSLVENDDDIVLSIDCDVMLTCKFLNNLFLKKNVIYTVNPKFAVNGTAGTSIFTKGMYFCAGGTNEHMNFGWGREDIDMYDRVSQMYKCLYYSQEHVYHQPHGDDLRVKYTKEKNKWVSNAKNLSASRLRFKDVLIEEYKNPYKIYYHDGTVRSYNE